VQFDVPELGAVECWNIGLSYNSVPPWSYAELDALQLQFG
jgi:hypothetical protein